MQSTCCGKRCTWQDWLAYCSYESKELQTLQLTSGSISRVSKIEEIVLGNHDPKTFPWNGSHSGRGYQDDVPEIAIDLSLVKHLIAAGTDVNAVDSRGHSCLHYAVENEEFCDVLYHYY
ncbi:hypothetical protein QAD02_016127 [Eretmocerus hayati]|uniref:Uncharacterized protein n=1 Tax=Eretmocerus hayati TaxID=131215 RepID=A0ACC2PEZ6_9HYME|nr:hypothetical protein QAD02_016127 [Eretmocerus hayati]